MAIRYFALIAGFAYVAMGIMGFIPAFVSPAPVEPVSLVVESGYGYLMGLFPINILHNFVHLAIGLWGILAFRDPKSSWYFAAGLTILYSILAAMGFVPVLGTTLGLVPIFGNDIFLHLGTAFVAGYFAFIRKSNEVSFAQPEKQGYPSTTH